MSTEAIFTLVMAALVPAITGLAVLWSRQLSNRDKKIEALQSKVETQNILIDELKSDKLKLEVTSTVVERFFSQLIPAQGTHKEHL